MLRKLNLIAAILATPLLVAGGCPGGGIIVPDIDDDEITVRVINNTDFDIDPGIEFGRSINSLRFLDLGILFPGEVVDVDIDCDDVFILTSTDAIQFGIFADFVLDPLPFFELDFEYFCGELVLFEFVGNGTSFDVFVDAGGENIY